MPIARSTIVGSLAGAAVLAGFVGFAVGLPEVVGDSAAAAESTHPPLEELLPPDLLDRGLVPLGEFDPSLAERAEQADTYSTETLSEVFEAETAVARYANADLQAQLSLTITEAESSFFLQSGPPAPAELTQAQGIAQELTRTGDIVCAELLQSAPAGEVTPGGEAAEPVPLQVQCQTESGGLTYNAYAVNGMTAVQTIDALEDAIAQVEAEIAAQDQ